MKPGVVSHTCDSNTWDITKVRSWVQGYLGLRSRIMSQKKKKKSLGIYWYTVSVIKTLDRSDKISCNKACVDINLVLGKELIISYQLRSSSATLKKKSFFFLFFKCMWCMHLYMFGNVQLCACSDARGGCPVSLFTWDRLSQHTWSNTGNGPAAARAELGQLLVLVPEI